MNLETRVPEKMTFCEHLALESPARKAREADPEVGESRQTVEMEQTRETRPVPVLEALGALNRWVLLGPPGSGKSTITNFVALQLARSGLQEPEALEKLGSDWNLGTLLPVRIVLRQFAAGLKSDERGRAAHLWEFIRDQLKYDSRSELTLDCIHQLSISEGVLFLLDGLDEVRDEGNRWAMLESLVEFLGNSSPKSRYLLTSRPYAWDDLLDLLQRYESGTERERRALNLSREHLETLRSLTQQTGPSFRLASLEDDQIQEFIRKWYTSVSAKDWLNPADAGEKTGELIAAAGPDRPDLHELARNPLPLTLMATLHTNRARLPEDREDLYNEVVELLLLRWNETTGADKGLLEALQMPELKLGDLREVMERLAFETHRAHVGREGVADIAEATLVAELKPLLRNSSDKAELAVRYIEDRSGLLLGQGERGRNRQYTFPHRTFQEYLAACHLANHDEFYCLAHDLARENAGHWREVLALAARHAKVSRGVSCADAVIKRQRVEDVKAAEILEVDFQAAIVAGRQLLEIGLAPLNTRVEYQTVRARVVGWLVHLLQKGCLTMAERFDAGVILGKLGDPRPGVGLSLEGPLQGVPNISWVRIPQGPFKMGGKDRWHGRREFECRLIKAPYEISRYPVTCGQYAAFVADGGYREPKLIQDGGYWTGAGLAWLKQEKITGPDNNASVFQTPNHPRVGVSWYEVVAFCVWLSRKTGEELRLPSEVEWERAARGVNGRTYPWGEAVAGDVLNQYLAERCNCKMSGIGSTSAVGLFSRGDTFPLEPGQSSGISDLSGNVWEWCGTKWVGDYKAYEDKDL